jgi:hypothetical protein
MIEYTVTNDIVGAFERVVRVGGEAYGKAGVFRQTAL